MICDVFLLTIASLYEFFDALIDDTHSEQLNFLVKIQIKLSEFESLITTWYSMLASLIIIRLKFFLELL